MNSKERLQHERETHFLGFARRVVADLLDGPGYIEVTEPYEDVYELIAKHAYDLVQYAYHSVDNYMDEPLTWDELLRVLPDPHTDRKGKAKKKMTRRSEHYLVSQEQFAQLKENVALTAFMLDVLQLLDEVDSYSEPIIWVTYGDYAPITFFVNCNDLFYWSSADAEKLLPEDMPDLRQAITDVRNAGIELGDISIGFELWVCRKRTMRPQRAAYPNTLSPEVNLTLRALFDACGPERTDA